MKYFCPIGGALVIIGFLALAVWLCLPMGEHEWYAIREDVEWKDFVSALNRMPEGRDLASYILRNTTTIDQRDSILKDEKVFRKIIVK